MGDPRIEPKETDCPGEGGMPPATALGQESETPSSPVEPDPSRVATLFVVKLVAMALVLGFGEAYLTHIGWGMPLQTTIAAIAGWIAQIFDDSIKRAGHQMLSGDTSLIVSLECTALYATALFCSATIAYPARWRDRGVGILVGFFGVAILNIFRLVVLALVAGWSARLFNFAHLVLMQWFLISCIAPMWLAWAVWATKRERAAVHG